MDGARKGQKSTEGKAQWDRSRCKGLHGDSGKILERQHRWPVVTFSHYDVLTDFVVLEIASFL